MGPRVVGGADTAVGVPAVAPVLAARSAGHALTSPTEVAGWTVTGATLDVAQPAVQTGAGLAGPCNATAT